MGNQIDTSKPGGYRPLFGRKQIIVSESSITKENLIEVLGKAQSIHNTNAADIDYLYQYYKGKQPILGREKTVRPEICNRIVENRANEIVSFKVGYLCGEPIQYVSKEADDSIVSAVNELNAYMEAQDKASHDQEIIEWQMICGTSYRMVLTDSREVRPEEDAPFELYTLDPRQTYVVYGSDAAHSPLMGVMYYKDDQNVKHTSVYTETEFFELEDDKILTSQKHYLGMVPIFEYPANNSRLGSFEIVIPLLDAMNNLTSNRLDGIEQTIQSFVKFINCDIDAEQFQQLKDLGAIKVKSLDGQKADVDIITTHFSQTESQTSKNDLYEAVLNICGMPNRNGGTSTSDTGTAVMLRDGWTLAEARAKDSERVFKKAEKKMLKLVLKICQNTQGCSLKLRNLDVKFTRRNYENIQSKSQVLISMLQEPKIHPQLAFLHSGMFSDAESAYSMSKEYYESQVREDDKTQENMNVGEDDKAQESN